MHKTVAVFVLFGLVLMTGAVMAETPGGVEPYGLIGIDGLQKGVSAPDDAVCGWQPGFFLDDLDGSVGELTVYDDGTGNAIYAGGSFTTAGGVTVNSVAKWDGAAWSALSGHSGTGVGGYDIDVYTLGVYDDGTGPALYVGGNFTTAGGITVNGIAMWDGTAWSGLSGPSGTGMSEGEYASVRSLAVYDDGTGPALYAGGFFTTAGGVTANSIAKWNGTEWSALSGPSGTGMGGSDPYWVSALAVYDDGTGPALYAGGSFATAGGVIANSIAKWNGTAWLTLSGPTGNGVNDTVHTLGVYDDGTGPALYAGGSFTMAGGVTVNYIAKWTGTAWSALSGPSGSGTDDTVSALTVHDDGAGEALYAGGSFDSAGGVAVNHIAKWNGTEWSDLSGPSAVGMDCHDFANGLCFVSALLVADDGSGAMLYGAGFFEAAGGIIANNIAKWDGSMWSALSEPSGAGMDYTDVKALAVHDDSTEVVLYAGGSFTRAGGARVNGIAQWNGNEWSPLSGPSGVGIGDTDLYSVFSIATYDDGTGPALFVGGKFTTAGGITVNHIAKWDGTAWSALSGPSGTGVSGGEYIDIVDALAVYDDGTGPALYAGGSFTTAGGITVNGIAKWDGASWSDLDGGVNGGVYSLAVYDDGTGDALYAGGAFSRAGGVSVYGIAKWDGASWSDLDGGMSGYVEALAVFDDGGGGALFAGGGFGSAGGENVYCIARWDGTSWSALSGPSGTGVVGPVRALAVYDDGTGEALYVGGGELTIPGGIDENTIAKWDGTVWSALGGPSGVDTNERVFALAIYDDGTGEAMYVGGLFSTAGGVASSGIGKWACGYRVFADGFETGDTVAWSVTQP